MPVTQDKCPSKMRFSSVNHNMFCFFPSQHSPFHFAYLFCCFNMVSIFMGFMAMCRFPFSCDHFLSWEFVEAPDMSRSSVLDVFNVFSRFCWGSLMLCGDLAQLQQLLKTSTICIIYPVCKNYGRFLRLVALYNKSFCKKAKHYNSVFPPNLCPQIFEFIL